MSARAFIDTNVVVYAYTLEDNRNERAVALLAEGGVTSVQVLNEFVNVARRKLGFEWVKIDRALDDLSMLLDRPLPLTVDVHRSGVEFSRRYGYDIYDSLILSAAKLAGCGLLYTEDLRDGQTIEGVLIRNPFRRDEPGL